jgi:hypothetical protein
MPRPGQQLSVLVSSHFLSSFFNDAAQWITSNLFLIKSFDNTICQPLSTVFLIQPVACVKMV